MAELGNEAKLFLKVIDERLQKKRAAVNDSCGSLNYSEDFKNGFNQCLGYVEATIRNLALELNDK